MEGFFKPFFAEPARHLYRLATDKEYFTYCRLVSRLWRVSRYTPRTVRIHKSVIHIPDAMSFVYMYKDIFVNKIYSFSAATSNPNILDLGANIGLSTLFFKMYYPGAKITAVEADPAIFKYLERNILGNNIRDIHLINRAVWNKSAAVNFYSEGADAGSFASHTGRKKIKVSAIDICELLDEKRYDYIKMDIEGAESVVLPACRDYLSNTSNIFVEYHSREGKKQELSMIIHILEECGFRLHIHTVNPSHQPLLHRKIRDGYDMQLNIFGWHDK
jgi:FkbM family methyltransferase